MIFRRTKREDPRLDITPLVDVVFLLIIFFTITTTFTTTSGIDIKLPSSNSERIIERDDKILITIQTDGTIWVDDGNISMSRLGSRLEGLFNQNNDALVVIQADESVKHGLVVKVMDLAQQTGLRRLAVATEPGSSEVDEKERVTP